MRFKASSTIKGYIIEKKWRKRGAHQRWTAPYNARDAQPYVCQFYGLLKDVLSPGNLLSPHPKKFAATFEHER